ncbi:MAG TPA: flagellin [Steroidobacteraceae bacterium]|nr:flagellin [Steroidobacteraceae bacterium]
MSLVLNTNYSSLVAQDSLSTSGSELSSALQQLSSGLRINTAADDAAGYAIVQGMTSQINGLDQAARNANDGVSLAQTAQGALTEITNDLQSMRDLAVQSLNATNSSQDRADLNQQFTQLQADINNVASTASFNGVNLLDGSFQGATFQVGANVGQTITVSSVASAKTSALGSLYTAAGTAATATATAGDSGTVSLAVTVGGVTKTYTTATFSSSGNQTTDIKTAVAAINSLSGQDGGIVATVDATTGGIDLSSTSGTLSVAATVNTVGTGTSVTAGALGLGAGTYDMTAATVTKPTFLDTGSVSTVDGSNQSLAQIDAALQQVAATGAQLGAYQNRFQAAISGLTTDATNLQSARSQIQDTDYAMATSQLSKAQILQQASTAMVAQANTIPQNILTLLQKLP